MNEGLSLAGLATALTAGLLGSLHCVGMCGPLASLGCRSGLVRNKLRGSLWFVAGKFLSYSLLGLLAGWLGSVFIGIGDFGRAVAVVSLIAGAMMIAVIAWSRFGGRSLAGLGSLVSRFFARSAMLSGRWAPLYLGISAAILPCGLLYGMVLNSAASGNALAGMALMQAFGLGTSPALLGIGTVLGWIPPRWSRHATAAGEAVLVLAAAVLIWRGYAGLIADTAGPACCAHP